MVFKKYAYGWITLGFFLGSLALHWMFGWQAFANEAAQHGQIPQQSEYIDEMLRDTFENWQSEFLQLLWQVVGLAYFLYVGSPASREARASPRPCGRCRPSSPPPTAIHPRVGHCPAPASRPGSLGR